MKIYTKKGDQGQTGLYGGERVSKDDLRIQAYGTLDELNALLGMIQARAVASKKAYAPVARLMIRLQAELFTLGAELATPRGKTPPLTLIGDTETATLEKEIDAWEKKLKPLKNFILPGGSEISAQVHFARTVSRRAERAMTTLNRAEPLRPEVLRYINRLSDHLFVCARECNRIAKIKDQPWAPR